jgi:hypothetical protein
MNRGFAFDLRMSTSGITGGILMITTGAIFLSRGQGKWEEVFALFHIFGGVGGIAASLTAKDDWTIATLGQLAAAIWPFAMGALGSDFPGSEGPYGPFGMDFWLVRVLAALLLITGALIAFIARLGERRISAPTGDSTRGVDVPQREDV